mmetsp:Transcript_109655/g.212301  ORF Transcript_109655/g.212301 Transcript_109655/m.212301 type:complete len:248 (+) Transcript_109655:185-928(+)
MALKDFSRYSGSSAKTKDLNSAFVIPFAGSATFCWNSDSSGNPWTSATWKKNSLRPSSDRCSNSVGIGPSKLRQFMLNLLNRYVSMAVSRSSPLSKGMGKSCLICTCSSNFALFDANNPSPGEVIVNVKSQDVPKLKSGCSIEPLKLSPSTICGMCHAAFGCALPCATAFAFCTSPYAASALAFLLAAASSVSFDFKPDSRLKILNCWFDHRCSSWFTVGSLLKIGVFTSPPEALQAILLPLVRSRR